jgi:hypothetical protein
MLWIEWGGRWATGYRTLRERLIGSRNVGDLSPRSWVYCWETEMWFWTSWEFKELPKHDAVKAGELQGREVLGPMGW